MADTNNAVIVDEVNVEKVVYPDVHWTVGADLIPSPIYQVYQILTNWAGKDDESLYNRFDVRDGNGNLLNSTVAFVAPVAADPEHPTTEEQAAIDKVNAYGNVGDNKFGYANGMVTISITPNVTMKTNNPFAIVNIDGKELDLGRLNSNITFDMRNKDHYVDIHWDGSTVETIRIVANR